MGMGGGGGSILLLDKKQQWTDDPRLCVCNNTAACTCLVIDVKQVNRVSEGSVNIRHS